MAEHTHQLYCFARMQHICSLKSSRRNRQSVETYLASVQFHGFENLDLYP